MSSRVVPQEVPVAFVYNGSSHAVMMATPHNLDDFAIGFSLNEGKISKPEDIVDLEIVVQESGIELRMWMSPESGHALARRRRAMLGPTGCGLCGVESLEQALPDLEFVQSEFCASAPDIVSAMEALSSAQILNKEARALHAAGFWKRNEKIIVREDVGRHNALDKLAGTLALTRRSAADGITVLTSRVSVELVQKAAKMGSSILVAVSAPTALALQAAEEAGITLVALARGSSFEVFSNPHRIVDLKADHYVGV